MQACSGLWLLSCRTFTPVILIGYGISCPMRMQSSLQLKNIQSTSSKPNSPVTSSESPLNQNTTQSISLRLGSPNPQTRKPHKADSNYALRIKLCRTINYICINKCSWNSSAIYLIKSAGRPVYQQTGDDQRCSTKSHDPALETEAPTHVTIAAPIFRRLLVNNFLSFLDKPSSNLN